jgi:hypothetical protein
MNSPFDLHSMKTECFSYILPLEFKKLLRYSFKAFFSGGPKSFLKKRKKGSLPCGVKKDGG